jgi:hypothetical protein
MQKIRHQFVWDSPAHNFDSYPEPKLQVAVMLSEDSAVLEQEVLVSLRYSGVLIVRHPQCSEPFAVNESFLLSGKAAIDEDLKLRLFFLNSVCPSNVEFLSKVLAPRRRLQRLSGWRSLFEEFFWLCQRISRLKLSLLNDLPRD